MTLLSIIGVWLLLAILTDWGWARFRRATRGWE